VNKQFHDEITDVMLRNYKFVQVVSNKIREVAFGRLKPGTSAQAELAARFKHYNMRINVSDHNCTDPIRCAYLLPGFPNFIDFCERVQLDDYRDETWSLTRLWWLIQFCLPKKAFRDEDAMQKKALSVIGKKWRNFEHLAIVNANSEKLARKIQEQVREPRWT